METLYIYTFGGLQVFYGHDPLPNFPRKKAASLFCYLALNRHRFHHREVLADLFWGESDSRNARGCLNTALWRLRSVLENNNPSDTYLLMERDQVRFNPKSKYWFDVEEFERRCDSTKSLQPSDLNEPQRLALEEAVQLYKGDFLEGFYDDWCLYERERLFQMFLRALANLMVYHGAKGHYDEGIAYGQRILSLDPLREEVHRQIMRYHQLAGRRAEALQQFAVCRSVLQKELGIEPMPETEGLYRKIRDGRGDTQETRGPTGHYSRPITQMAHALAQLRLALDRFDEARRQLAVAVAAVEKLSSTVKT